MVYVAPMGWLDRLLGREEPGVLVKDGVCTFRRREIAEQLRRPREFGEAGPKTCRSCGKTMAELVLTTGGAFGDPELWRDVPVTVDGWACLECGRYLYPRKMDPARIQEFMNEGLRHARTGRFADAEWWFARVVWDWPGVVLPAHINYAEATRNQITTDLEPVVRRRLTARMREHYEEAVEAYARHPEAAFVPPIARAHLTLAEVAIDDRAFDRAERSADACLALPGLDSSSIEHAQRLRRYVRCRFDLFGAASKVILPYLDFQDHRHLPVDTPEDRAAVARAVENLEQHYALAPDNWQAAHFIAKGRAALGDAAGALESWRAAWRAHPGQTDIVRGYGLALLHADLVAEACDVARDATERIPSDATLWCNRAVTEILVGDLASARRCLTESLRLDPSDSIAKTLAAQLAEYEAGKPTPKTLRDLEREPLPSVIVTT